MAELSGTRWPGLWGRAGLARPRGASPQSWPRSLPQLALEEPLETAILLSLVGVKSVVANQWPTVLQDNALRAGVLWENLLAVGTPVGKAVRLLQKMGAAEPANTDESPSTSGDRLTVLQLRMDGPDPLATALGLVLYGLPHQAIQ